MTSGKEYLSSFFASSATDLQQRELFRIFT